MLHRLSGLYKSRLLRAFLLVLLLGVACACVWAFTTVALTLDYSAWYGYATSDLIKTSIHEIEDGNLGRVLTVWRGLERQYQPTYENRAKYDTLVAEATRRMRGDVPIEPGSPWDATAFSGETWDGHWEDDSGYWLVIDSDHEPFDIVRSGDFPNAMESVTASPDFTVLKFKEGDKWLHTLTLKNKYELSHEWFDVEKGRVWESVTMHKLVRAKRG